MKSRVIFIIVPSYSKSVWLNTKMLQITKSFISILNVDEYPLYTVNDYNDINLFLDKAEFLVIATAGTVIVERDHLIKKINEFPSDVGIMGHLLQFDYDSTPYMHEQFFIINCRAIQNVDLNFEKHFDKGIELVRSDEDLHDGHAPLFVTLGKKQVERHLQFGTKLIEQSLLNGYKVTNFDNTWRYSEKSNDYVRLDNIVLPTRGFCYPTKSTEVFEKSLKDLTIRQELDEAQKLFISAIQKILEFNVLNYWHYEYVPEIQNYDHIICTATGFLAEMMALKCNASKITFYDKNANNLDFKKYLYSKWNGKNYNEFAISWAKERNLSLEPSFDIDKTRAEHLSKETHEHLFNSWSEWKGKVEVNFIYQDLLMSDLIVESITEKSVIHTSTILTIYPFTSVLYDEEQINDVKEKLIKKILKTNSKWISV